MHRNSPARRSTLATASRVATTHTRTVYATDLGAARPLSAPQRALVARNQRRIAVGHEERTPFGTLRCERVGNEVVVRLQRGRRLVGRALSLRGAGDGPYREAAFSVEVDEFVGTPWHELEYTSVWTVHGLRTRGREELTVDRR